MHDPRPALRLKEDRNGDGSRRSRTSRGLTPAKLQLRQPRMARYRTDVGRGAGCRHNCLWNQDPGAFSRWSYSQEQGRIDTHTPSVQVREVRLPHSMATGPCYARSLLSCPWALHSPNRVSILCPPMPRTPICASVRLDATPMSPAMNRRLGAAAVEARALVTRAVAATPVAVAPAAVAAAGLSVEWGWRWPGYGPHPVVCGVGCGDGRGAGDAHRLELGDGQPASLAHACLPQAHGAAVVQRGALLPSDRLAHAFRQVAAGRGSNPAGGFRGAGVGVGVGVPEL